MKIVGEKYLKYTTQFRHLHHTLHISKIKTIMKAQKSNRHFQKHFPQYPTQYTWNYRNMPLHAYVWEPVKTPKALIVNFNALNAHTGLSGSMAERFADSGIIMSGFDYPNFGRSYSPEPGHIQSIQNLIEISQQFLKHTVNKYPGVPVFLNGLSMGGLIAFHIGLRKPVPINGCILLNPAFRDNPLNNGFLKKIVMYSGMLFPKFQTMKPIRSSSTKHSLQKYKHIDKNMYSGRVWTSTTWALLSHMKNTAKKQRFSQFDIPFLCVQGGSDKVLYPFTVFELEQLTKSRDKQIVIIPDLWHALWFDDHHDEVVEMVKTWISERITIEAGIREEKERGEKKNKKMAEIGRNIKQHHHYQQIQPINNNTCNLGGEKNKS